MPAYYNPYIPQGSSINPYNYGQPSMYAGGSYTPIQQPQQQSSLLTVFVDSEEEVNMYPVAAGVTVMLVSFKLGKFYLKTTGKNGVPEPLRVFPFTEETATSPVPTQNQNPLYASAEALENISNKLNDLIAKLGGDE